jgi:hypothetical protein
MSFFALFRPRLALLAELDAERRKLEVANAEIESLSAVIERDRRRVRAETADFNQRIAQAEAVNVKR